MRLYCLASICKIPPDENYIEPTPYDEDADEMFTPFYSNCNNKELLEILPSNYRLTEICIGWKKFEEDPNKSFVIEICQTFSEHVYFRMLRGLVKVTFIDKDNGIFDLHLATSKLECLAPEFVPTFDLKIKAFCIKNTKKLEDASLPGILTLDEEIAYHIYAKQIFAFWKENPHITEDNLRAAVLQKYGPINLPNQSTQKVLKQKLTDFQTAIDLLCNPKTGSYSNITPTVYDPITKKSKASRIYQKVECLLYLKESTWYTKNPRTLLHKEMEKFRHCTALDWNHVYLDNKIDYSAFIFLFLKIIEFKKVDLGQDMEFWYKLAAKINFSKVHSICLQDCGIKVLDDKFFEFLLPSLRVLNLSSNDITYISKDIEKLINLQKLEVNDNIHLGDEGFPWKHVPSSLDDLKLECTNICKIPNEIEKLERLNMLSISSTKLKNVSRTPCNWRKRDWHKFGEIKLHRDNITNTYTLELKNIKIDEIISPVFEYVKKFYYKEITSFYFFNNELKDFNILDINYPKLRELTVTINGLQTFSWKQLPTSIQKFDLTCNEIETMLGDEEEIDFSAFKELADISFQENQISYLPKGFENLPKLKKLNLRSNKFGNSEFSLPTDAMKSSNDLETLLWKRIPTTIEQLDLSVNNIKSISVFERIIDFTTFSHLKELSFEKNDLKFLPKGFENLPALEDLNLNNNKFDYNEYSLIEVLWHRLPKSLKKLKLKYNKIYSIPCCLKTIEIDYLNATGCYLRHICPYLHTNVQNSKDNRIFFVVICNPDLELSFIPNTIYQLPKADVKPVDDVVLDFANFPITEILTSENTPIRDTSKTKYNNKSVYEFKTDEVENAYSCKCCATCGETTDEPLFKQQMAMDIYLRIERQYRTKQDEEVCYEPAFKEFGKVNENVVEKKKTKTSQESEIIEAAVPPQQTAYNTRTTIATSTLDDHSVIPSSNLQAYYSNTAPSFSAPSNYLPPINTIFYNDSQSYQYNDISSNLTLAYDATWNSAMDYELNPIIEMENISLDNDFVFPPVQNNVTETSFSSNEYQDELAVWNSFYPTDDPNTYMPSSSSFQGYHAFQETFPDQSSINLTNLNSEIPSSIADETFNNHYFQNL